jgi:ParB family transcriptional regulator, chromosome partitioning protein
MTEIINVPLASVDANPFRLLGDYPFVERKLEALQRSYADVGIWEGVIARKVGNRFQIAFGHHRIEAARLSGTKQVPLIVRDLTDEQMIQFMGRENLEDYNADFLVMLETWEAAIKFRGIHWKETKAIEVARLLGWTRVDWRSSTGREGHELNMTDTARACHAAHALIAAGHLTRGDLIDLSVNAAREIVERAQTRIEQVEKMAADTKRPKAEIRNAKQQIGKAAKIVARQYREGKSGLGIKDLRGQVDAEAFRGAAQSRKQSPLFAVFGRAVAEQIHKMLRHDMTADRLQEIVNALPQITMAEDHEIVREIDFRLAEHEAKTHQWRKELAPKGGNVIPYKALEDRRVA